MRDDGTELEVTSRARVCERLASAGLELDAGNDFLFKSAAGLRKACLLLAADLENQAPRLTFVALGRPWTPLPPPLPSGRRLRPLFLLCLCALVLLTRD